MTKWKSLGRLLSDNDLSWSTSHLSLPVLVPLEGDDYKLFFSSRDVQNRSHVGYADIRFSESPEVLHFGSKPLLCPGSLGEFDDHGVYAASIVATGKKYNMYTIGWNPGCRPPLFYASIGLATSTDKMQSFHKTSPAPIISRSAHDPCLVTSPVVILDKGMWKMWYVSGYKWTEIDGKLQSHYHIKYAESIDGIDWVRKGIVCMDKAFKEELNISRFWVIQEDGLYHAWFSSHCPKTRYSIKYAYSQDGIQWQREPNFKLDGLGDWDDKEQAYPCVIKHKGRFYMFYNGNNFGRTGIGVAVLDD